MFGKTNQALLTSVCLMTALSISPAQAAPADPVQVKLTANEVVKNSKGVEQLRNIGSLNGKEVVRYSATYTNTSDGAISDMAVTLPIPANMSFNGAASPSSALASIDGVNYLPMPLTQVIDGKTVKVPYSQYKSLRWQIKLLPARKSATVTADTQLDLTKS
jgi:hypothetical protein